MNRKPMPARKAPLRCVPLKGGIPLGRGDAGLKRRVPLKAVPRERKPARYTGPSRKVRALVLQRDGFACVCCGKSVIGQEYSLQHRKRRSQGGGNSPSNLVTVLGSGSRGCHWRIDSRRDPSDEAKGYTVRSGQDPALVPVVVVTEAGHARLWPLDDGTWSAQPPAVAA